MKNAIITGSSRGVGRAIAGQLAKEGYRVWLSARNAEALNTAKAEIEAIAGAQVRIRAIDLANSAEVDAYADHLLNECDRIDVLVNNAGVYQPDDLFGNLDQFESQMSLNFYAPFRLTQKLLPRLLEQKEGHIFNMCSIVNAEPRPSAASYTISKFALYAYHKLLHKTLLPKGIKVTAFLPGSINTSSWDGIEAPKETFIQPDDIASMVANMLTMKKGTVPSEVKLNAINPDY